MRKSSDVVSYNLDTPFEFMRPKPIPWNVSIHVHDICEIYQACVDGIVYFVEGNAYQLKKHDIIITNQNELHRPHLANSDSYDRRFIQFKPSAFMPFFDTGYNPLRIFTKRKLGSGNLIICESKSPCNLLINQIESLSAERSTKNRLLIKTLLVQLFSELDSMYSKNATHENNSVEIDPRVTSILSHLNENFSEPLSLDALSAQYFLNKYYLCHLFKDNTGFSIREYIQSKRIQKAKQLISEGMPITEASRLCGYDDYANFYKAFQKLVHISPSDYVKSLNAN